MESSRSPTLGKWGTIALVAKLILLLAVFSVVVATVVAHMTSINHRVQESDMFGGGYASGDVMTEKLAIGVAFTALFFVIISSILGCCGFCTLRGRTAIPIADIVVCVIAGLCLLPTGPLLIDAVAGECDYKKYAKSSVSYEHEEKEFGVRKDFSPGEQRKFQEVCADLFKTNAKTIIAVSAIVLSILEIVIPVGLAAKALNDKPSEEASAAEAMETRAGVYGGGAPAAASYSAAPVAVWGPPPQYQPAGPYVYAPSGGGGGAPPQMAPPPSQQAVPQGQLQTVWPATNS